MTIKRNQVNRARFNRELDLPFQLRVEDFALAMQDVYESEGQTVRIKYSAGSIVTVRRSTNG